MKFDLKSQSDFFIHDVEFSRMKSYLNKWFQTTIHRRKQPSLLILKNGVPKGSVLMPFLFLILLEMYQFFFQSSKCTLYSDNCPLLVDVRDPNNLN